MIKKITYSILLILIIFDLGYSFSQHYNMPLDGDMPGGIVPNHDVKPILESPFGFKALKDGVTYPNPNRFFSHWTFYEFFNNIPQIFNHFVKPIDSVYLSCAISKISIQIVLLCLLSIFITGTLNFLKFEFVLSTFLIAPLFQTNGFKDFMGIIDPSTTYTFFYALPIIFLLIYFLPLFIKEYYGFKIFNYKVIVVLWIPLAIITSLSGPLNPGIALIVVLLFISKKIFHNKGQMDSDRFYEKIINNVRNIPYEYYVYLVPIGILSLYSLYLGTYNSLSIENTKPLLDLYLLLPIGIYNSQKYGVPLLYVMLCLNYILIKSKGRTNDTKKLFSLFNWIGVFSFIYLLLLPLGGYRPWRPYIIRYDTILPITLCLIFLFGKTTIFVLKNTSLKQRIWYIPILTITLIVFSIADQPEFQKNDCEKEALIKIAESKESLVVLENQCNVISWNKIIDPKESIEATKLLKIWGIIDVEKQYFQK